MRRVREAARKALDKINYARLVSCSGSRNRCDIYRMRINTASLASLLSTPQVWKFRKNEEVWKMECPYCGRKMKEISMSHKVKVIKLFFRRGDLR